MVIKLFNNTIYYSYNSIKLNMNIIYKLYVYSYYYELCYALLINISSLLFLLVIINNINIR